MADPLAGLYTMIKTDPFPRFERKGLLDISEDNQYYIVNPALLAALTPSSKDELRPFDKGINSIPGAL